MGYDDPRAAEARILRAQGLSRSQIRERLGPVANGTLTEWLRGTKPPAWTRRPRAKDGLRRQARELRRQGRTYDDQQPTRGVEVLGVALGVGYPVPRA